jgi:hypothetical protein
MAPMLVGTAGILGGAGLRPTSVQSQTGTAPAAAVPGSAPPGTRYGDPAWWAQRKEEILEPALEIVDPHHHLWDRGGHRYLLDQLLADTGSGHNITQSVRPEPGLQAVNRGIPLRDLDPTPSPVEENRPLVRSVPPYRISRRCARWAIAVAGEARIGFDTPIPFLALPESGHLIQPAHREAARPSEELRG